ncbi:MAG TPA: DinB family protein [Acidimicrobiales bacterium]|nr:DinB family protein [Acidimicrobiales bacterium]
MSVHDGWDAPRPGWVCSQCGFCYDAQDLAATPTLAARLGARYRTRLLQEASADVDSWRQRPDPDTWSALEYACHMRDCFALYDWRIRKVLDEQRVILPAMRRDDVVTERAYNQQDPDAVAEEIERNARSLSSLLAGVAGERWSRVGVREGEELSVGWMARNVIHEGIHHLADIDAVLGRVPAGKPFE